MKRIFCITDYGAISDGTNLQTTAIQAAIDACFSAGGGEVTVPAGVYRSGGLRLRSRVTLHLLTGAVLQGSRDPEDYTHFFEDTLEDTPPCYIPEAFSRRVDSRWCNAFLRAYEAHDVAIIGDPGSVIDGQNTYDAQGEEGFRGPHAIGFFRCRNIRLSGYTVYDSGNWANILFDCRCIYIRDIHVRGGHDGIHLRGCDHAVIEDCTLHTGDDSIAGYNNRGVAILRCQVNSSCSAFRFGGTDVLIDQCRIFGPGLYGHRCSLSQELMKAGALATPGNSRHNTLTAFLYFCVKDCSMRATPGNIVLQNCDIEQVDRLFEQDFSINHIWCGGQGTEDITFRNCRVRGVKRPFCSVSSPNEPTVVTLEDVDISPTPETAHLPLLDIGGAAGVRLVRLRAPGYTSPTVVLRPVERGSTPCPVAMIDCDADIQVVQK